MSSPTSADADPVVEPALAIRLVLGVARLGEADLAAWWSSQGLNPAVRFVLAGFHRTGQVAGAELALLSAERRHRQLLPRANASHLFSPRLPYVSWARADLAEMKSAGASPLLDELSDWATVDEAVATLRSWSAAPGNRGHLYRLVEPYLEAATAGRQLSAEDIDLVNGAP